MRTKSIYDFWNQLERIRNYCDDVPTKEQTLRINMSCRIYNQYAQNIYPLIAQDLEKGMGTKFPASVYAKQV